VSHARKKLLIKLESLIGSECYNSNIQNFGAGGVFQGEGREFRYPISFYKDSGETIKQKNVDREIEEEVFQTGHYSFGANQLQIVRGLEKVLEHLECEHGLKIKDNSKIIRKNS
jgi:hypothetical protein